MKRRFTPHEILHILHHTYRLQPDEVIYAIPRRQGRNSITVDLSITRSLCHKPPYQAQQTSVSLAPVIAQLIRIPYTTNGLTLDCLAATRDSTINQLLDEVHAQLFPDQPHTRFSCRWIP